MSPKKSSAEEELEKQYKEYRGQFEQWKEKNKGSVGTDAYNEYVKSFMAWEEDVEKRRKILREKAEKEASELRAQQEEEERKAREVQDAIEAEQAAYAASQQAYIAHHQKAMESEKRQQQQQHQQQQHHHQQQHQHQQQQQHLHHQQQQQQHAVVHVQAQVHSVQAQFTTTNTSVPPPRIGHDPSLNTDAVMREMMNVVMGGAAAAIGTTAVTQQPPPSHDAAPVGPPPQLWGSTKVPYDAKDPLFMKWGPRAAPPHVPQPPRTGTVVTPGWMLVEMLKDRKMMIAPHLNLPPPQMFPL